MKSSSTDRPPRMAVQPGRRRFLHGLAAAAAAASMPVAGHAHGIGIVDPPLALPATGKLVRHDGLQVPLQTMLAGKTTALQLMFTGCSQTCPLQGALFAEVQSGLQRLAAKDIQLLSLSIDPFDDQKALAAWLRKFGARANWIAALPAPKDLDAITRSLQQGANPKANHSTQVFFFNRRGQLIWRSEEFPPARVVTGILERIVTL